MTAVRFAGDVVRALARIFQQSFEDARAEPVMAFVLMAMTGGLLLLIGRTLEALK